MYFTEIKQITDRHSLQLDQKVREKGISGNSLKKFLENPKKLQKFFRGLSGENKLLEKLQSSAEKIGARVHLIPRLIVDYTKSHNILAMEGGPETNPDCSILRVADRYQLTENKIVKETIVLLNWAEGDGSYQKAVEWAFLNGLQKTVPKEVFSIGKQIPNLNYELGLTHIYLNETTGYSFYGSPQVCFVGWYDDKRKSNIYWQEPLGISCDWFVFRKKK